MANPESGASFMERVNKDSSLWYNPSTTSAFSVEESRQKLTDYLDNVVDKEIDRRFDISRNAAEYTLANVEKWEDLDTFQKGTKASDLDPYLESEQYQQDKTAAEDKFAKKTRETWKGNLVTHIVRNGETKGKSATSDLDGNSAIYLMRLLGIEGGVQYVDKGKSVDGKVVIDTANKDGVSFDKDSGTLYIDHHGTESGSDSSATKNAYEAMKYQGLIDFDKMKVRAGGTEFVPTEEDFDKFIDFVTKVDNADYPQEYFDNYKDMARTMFGLQQFVRPENLLRFFHEGRNPMEQLSDDDLKKYGFKYFTEKKDSRGGFVLDANGKRIPFEVDYSKVKQANIEESIKNLDILSRPEAGYTLDCGKFGKTFVQIKAFNQNTVPDHLCAAYAAGFDTDLLWDPNANIFFISARNGIPEGFSLPVGRKMRNKMWITENGTKADFSLFELLEMMAGKELDLQGEFAQRYELEKSKKAEPKAELDEVFSKENLDAAFEPGAEWETRPKARGALWGEIYDGKSGRKGHKFDKVSLKKLSEITIAGAFGGEIDFDGVEIKLLHRDIAIRAKYDSKEVIIVTDPDEVIKVIKPKTIDIVKEGITTNDFRERMSGYIADRSFEMRSESDEYLVSEQKKRVPELFDLVKEDLRPIVEEAAKNGMIKIRLSPESQESNKLQDYDKTRLAMYRSLAKEFGFEVGEYNINFAARSAEASVNKTEETEKDLVFVINENQDVKELTDLSEAINDYIANGEGEKYVEISNRIDELNVKGNEIGQPGDNLKSMKQLLEKIDEEIKKAGERPVLNLDETKLVVSGSEKKEEPIPQVAEDETEEIIFVIKEGQDTGLLADLAVLIDDYIMNVSDEKYIEITKRIDELNSAGNKITQPGKNVDRLNEIFNLTEKYLVDNKPKKDISSFIADAKEFESDSIETYELSDNITAEEIDRLLALVDANTFWEQEQGEGTREKNIEDANSLIAELNSKGSNLPVVTLSTKSTAKMGTFLSVKLTEIENKTDEKASIPEDTDGANIDTVRVDQEPTRYFELVDGRRIAIGETWTIRGDRKQWQSKIVDISNGDEANTYVVRFENDQIVSGYPVDITKRFAKKVKIVPIQEVPSSEVVTAQDGGEIISDTKEDTADGRDNVKAAAETEEIVVTPEVEKEPILILAGEGIMEVKDGSTWTFEGNEIIMKSVVRNSEGDIDVVLTYPKSDDGEKPAEQNLTFKDEALDALLSRAKEYKERIGK